MSTRNSWRRVFAVALIAVVLLSNYSLALLDGFLSALLRGFGDLSGPFLISMLAGPIFVLAFASIFLLVLGQLGPEADASTFVARYRFHAKVILLFGLITSLSTYSQIQENALLFMIPLSHIFMSLTVYVSAFLRTDRSLHKGMFLITLLLLVGAFFTAGPILHYRNLFFHASQIIAWICYYYCETRGLYRFAVRAP